MLIVSAIGREKEGEALLQKRLNDMERKWGERLEHFETEVRPLFMKILAL